MLLSASCLELCRNGGAGNRSNEWDADRQGYQVTKSGLSCSLPLDRAGYLQYWEYIVTPFHTCHACALTRNHINLTLPIRFQLPGGLHLQGYGVVVDDVVVEKLQVTN